MSIKKLLAAAATLILGATGAVPVHAQAGFSATMVGHEYRQDDLPAVASAPDGSVWVAWLSFAGDRDDEPSDETGQLVATTPGCSTRTLGPATASPSRTLPR